MTKPVVSPIDRYLDVTFTRYQEVLAATPLDEPITADPVIALRRVGYLVETLTAFALGHAVGRVAELLRRSCDSTVRVAIERELVRVGGASERLRDRTTAVDRRRTDSPLVGELRGKLHARLWRAAGHARALLTAIDKTIARLDPERLATITTVLSVLAEDDITALVFADQLTLGWRYFIALAEGRPDPAVGDDPRWRRARALWAAWANRVREDQPTRPTRAERQPAGFILRVA